VLFLLFGQIPGNSGLQLYIKGAALFGIFELGITHIRNSEHLSGLRAFGNVEPDLLHRGLYRYRAAKHQKGHINGLIQIEFAILKPVAVMGGNFHRNQQVAARTAVGPVLPFVLQLQLSATHHTRRDLNAHFFLTDMYGSGGAG
jgi:hypothetical protein